MFEGPRGTLAHELNDVLQLVNLVFRTSRGLPPKMGEEYPLLFNEENVENLRIIKLDGKVISHVGIFECEALIYSCRLKVGMIGSVCTHPDYRRRGLASRLLEDAFRKMRNDGVNIVMVSGIRTLYDRAGCAIAGRSHLLTFTRTEAKRIQEAAEVEEAGPEDALDIAKLYQQEPVRFLRPLKHLTTLLSIKAWYSGGRQTRLTLLVYQDSLPAGYAVIHTPADARGEAKVVEYAGHRAAVLQALKKVIEEGKANMITMKVPEWDTNMKVELARHHIPLPSETVPPADTARLLNAEETFKKLEPYFSERGAKVHLEAKEKGYTVTVDGEELKVEGEKELAWLVFGTPDRVPDMYRKFMARHPTSPKKFSKVFPIPLIPYGLYYT